MSLDFDVYDRRNNLNEMYLEGGKKESASWDTSSVVQVATTILGLACMSASAYYFLKPLAAGYEGAAAQAATSSNWYERMIASPTFNTTVTGIKDGASYLATGAKDLTVSGAIGIKDLAVGTVAAAKANPLTTATIAGTVAGGGALGALGAGGAATAALTGIGAGIGGSAAWTGTCLYDLDACANHTTVGYYIKALRNLPAPNITQS